MTADDVSRSTAPVEVFDFRTHIQTPPEVYRLTRPVFFVGFMGAGKTTVSRKLARLAGAASVDMDKYIERVAGKKIADIFKQSGEEAFRELETCVLEELATADPQIISCGGGVVLKERNREILKEHGYVIYLEVTADEAAQRISDTESRPLFKDLENAQRVINERLDLYEEVATVSIDTTGRGTGSLAHELLDALKQQGILVRE